MLFCFPPKTQITRRFKKKEKNGLSGDVTLTKDSSTHNSDSSLKVQHVACLKALGHHQWCLIIDQVTLQYDLSALPLSFICATHQTVLLMMLYFGSCIHTTESCGV